ncbi:MAG: helix-turn-helix domain-containing protein [Candidatus Dormibacteria bacterium]
MIVPKQRAVTMEPSRTLLPYGEAARRLGIGDRTLRGLVYSGRLPAVRLGTRRLIAEADLDAFVAELREEAGR